MFRKNKHDAQKVAFAPLSGGVNVSVPASQIAENEMSLCENFIYEKDSAKLVGRGGLQKIRTYSSNIIALFYDIETNLEFVFLENGTCYEVILGDTETKRTNLQQVTGKKQPKCCKFKNMLFVASGGHLQFYDFSAERPWLQSIVGSPVCDNLFYRWGRLMVSATGSDRITYSAVGDASSDQAWVEKTNDPSMSYWIDIGCDDDGDIVDIVPLATDIIVFKSNGKAYQFSGDSDIDTWAVYNVANFTDIVGNSTAGMVATNLGNQIALLSLRGLKTLSATQDYGNVAAADIGDKFNSLLTNGMYEPEIFHLRRHKTLMIRPTVDKTYFVAYNYGLEVATVVRFGVEVNYILETKDDIYVAAGRDIYRWTQEATQDGNVPINYKLKPREVLGSEEMLVKSIDTKFTSDRAGDVSFKIGDRLNVTMPANSRRKVRCNHSCDAVDITVESNTRFELGHIYLDMAEL